MISSGINNIRNQIESVSFGSELKSKFQIGANLKRNDASCHHFGVVLLIWNVQISLSFIIIYFHVL